MGWGGVGWQAAALPAAAREEGAVWWGGVGWQEALMIGVAALLGG